MPYEMVMDHDECDGVAVVKKGDGKMMGCHPNQEAAQKQMAALMAAERSEEDDSNRAFTEKAWDGSAGRWPDAATYCSACMVDNNPSGQEKTKAECHFPYKEPNGDINVNALRAIVGGRGAQADFPGAQKARERARRLLEQFNNSQERSELMAGEIFYRSADLAYRDEDGSGILEGRMAPYNEWTEINSSIEGHFMERILPGAFTKTILERAARLRVLFEHGFSRLLDKQPIAALEGIRDEDDGAYYRAGLLPGLPDLFMEGLRRGLYGTSVAMRPLKGEVRKRPKPSDYNPEGLEERSVSEAFLREISVVTFPAYEGATATVRSLTDELVVAKLYEDPARLLQLVRAQVEPPHSEPPDEESGKASRSTPPKPKKDWLSTSQEAPPWRIP